MSEDFLSCQPLLDRLSVVMHKSKEMATFQRLPSIKEKIRYCLRDEIINCDADISIKKEISDLLQVFYTKSEGHRKSEEKAEQLKIKGSKAFMKKKDEEAYKLYTDALRYAPHQSVLSAVIFANRSATHIQRKNYKECLKDIKRAEDASYPPEYMHKLQKRKIVALLKLGQKKEAQQILLEAKKFKVPGNKDNSSNSLEELEKQINRLNFEEERLPPSIDLPDLYMGDKNQQISGALKIRVSEEDGRHIRAISNIPKGTALFCEAPFSAILLPEFFLSHCQRCLGSLINPIPCNICIDVLWCNERCKADGEVFHRYECCNLHILSSVGIAHLALRIILIAGWQICQQVRVEVQAGQMEDPTELFQSRDLKSRYKAVFSLLTHLESAEVDDLFQYSLAAIVLGKVILERTKFISPQFFKGPGKREEVEIDLSSLLVHHISQLVSNAHAVTQIERKSEGDLSPLSQVSQRRVASAIYPLASLMNHSCQPPIINSFFNDILIIHAVTAIPQGKQVFNCYGPHASREERKDRQLALKRQYFFNCTCLKCTDDQTLLKEASWSGLRCPMCRGIAVMVNDCRGAEDDLYNCLECESTGSLPAYFVDKCSNANTFFEDGQEALRKERYADAEAYFSKALKLGEEVFSEHNEFLNTTRDSLAKSYTLEGKYHAALRELSVCLKVVGARYGDESIEMAHELLKYLDVITVAQSLKPSFEKESQETRRKIHRIFTTHYGARWRSYLQLDL